MLKAFALWCCALILAACLDPDGGDPRTATIHLPALGEDVCAAHCALAVQAQLFLSVEDPFGIGPAAQPVTCDEALILQGVPAGAQVVVKAWASNGLDILWQGWSDPIVAASGSEVTASVVLQPVVRPSPTGVSPEPVVVSDRAESVNVTITGTTMGYGDGDATVMLAGTELAPGTWVDDEVGLTIPGGTTGGDLVVTTCGAASDPIPLRVIGPDVGSLEVGVSECAGATITSLAGAGNQALLGVSCQDGTGLVIPLSLADGRCAKDVLSVPTGGPPVAVHVLGDAGWVAVGTSPTLIAFGVSDGVVTQQWKLPGEPRAGGLAFVDGQPFVIAGGGVRRVVSGVLESFARFPPGPEPLGVAATDAGDLVVLAKGPGGLAQFVDLGKPGDTFLARQYTMNECEDPRDLAVGRDGTWVVATCGGDNPGLVAFPWAEALSGGQPTYASASGTDPSAVALDPAGDIAFVWDAAAGSVGVVHVPTSTLAATWNFATAGALGTTALAALGGDDLAADLLLVGGAVAGKLWVAAPWSPQAPCGGS